MPRQYSRLLADFSQDLFRPVNIPIVLHTGVPADLLGFGALLPALGRSLVPGVHPGDALGIRELKALAAGWQQIPAQSTVADTTLENQYGRIGHVPDMMPNPDLGSNLATLDGHPLVAEQLHRPSAASHDAHVADILTFRPFPSVIDQVGIEFLLLHRVFERAISTLDLSKAEHVGLAQKNVDLNRLAHIGRFAVRVGQLTFGAKNTRHPKAHGQEKAGDIEALVIAHKQIHFLS